jgi:hypothetical protein
LGCWWWSAVLLLLLVDGVVDWFHRVGGNEPFNDELITYL